MVTEYRGQQRIAPRFQQRFLGDRARRHDTHDFSLYRAFRRGRVADLLANGHRFSLPDQADQVVIEGMYRHAGHRYRLTRRLAARGQRDIKQPRRAARVIEEQLVKVAHAIEHQQIRVFGLDAQILLHHGRVFFGGGAAHG